jgi:outer membrane usher protein
MRIRAFKPLSRGRMRDISLTISAMFLIVGSALAESNEEKIMPLDVVINGHKVGAWTLVEMNDVIYAPQDAFIEWRVIPRQNAEKRTFLGQEHMALAAVPGYESSIDFASQTINVNFDAASFSATSLIKERDGAPVVDKVLPSAFVNYDVSYAATNPKDAPDVKELGLLAEIGVSNDWGVLTTKVAGRNLTNEASLGVKQSWARLETTFTKHFPQANLALQVGDSRTRPGLWGNSVYFGGLRLGTDYSLTPGFLSQPLPIVSGISSAPSTVDMYVNDVLRQSSNVPAGPFTIDNFPVLSGGGVARLVVRDALGRETVITQDFFTSNRLLTPGLADWSAELGLMRSNVGREDSSYENGFASGFWRTGVSDSFTAELRGEVSKDLQAVGVGALYALPGHHLVKAVLVGSHSPLGNGSQVLLGIERQEKHYSYALQVQAASDKFRQLGQDISTPATKLQVAANVSYNLDKMGSFGAALVSQTKFDVGRITTLSLNYATDIGKKGRLSLSASRAFGNLSGSVKNTISASFSMPLDADSGHTNLHASATSRDDDHNFYISASHSPSDGNGLSWRTLAGHQSQQTRAEGGVTYEGRYGSVNGDLSVSTDTTALRLGAKGGLVMAGGHFFATRVVDSSYGIAEVPGYANIGIGLGGNSLTKTDANGIALIPRMAAYQHNAVRIDPSELPISAEIDSIEQVSVPAYRSAVKVVFPVRSGRGALVKINFDDGQPAPVGATVYLDGDKQEFYVARHGAAFVTGLEAQNILKVVWKGQSCNLKVSLPPATDDDIARVGPLVCQGVAR